CQDGSYAVPAARASSGSRIRVRRAAAIDYGSAAIRGLPIVQRIGCAGLAAGLFALLFGAAASPASGQTGFGSVQFQNWGFFQRTEDGSTQWKYEPRLYIPYRFANGVTFTQRIDVPLIYTNASGPGNPGGGYSGGVGDMFIEEYLESAPVAENLRLKASVRFIF